MARTPVLPADRHVFAPLIRTTHTSTHRVNGIDRFQSTTFLVTGDDHHDGRNWQPPRSSGLGRARIRLRSHPCDPSAHSYQRRIDRVTQSIVDVFSQLNAAYLLLTNTLYSNFVASCLDDLRVVDRHQTSINFYLYFLDLSAYDVPLLRRFLEVNQDITRWRSSPTLAVKEDVQPTGHMAVTRFIHRALYPESLVDTRLKTKIPHPCSETLSTPIDDARYEA